MGMKICGGRYDTSHVIFDVNSIRFDMHDMLKKQIRPTHTKSIKKQQHHLNIDVVTLNVTVLGMIDEMCREKLHLHSDILSKAKYKDSGC